MPFYKFKDNNTNEEFEKLMGISAADSYLKENPHIERLFNGCPAIIGGTGDRVRPDAGFTDLLGRISRANPTSKLAEDYGDKGIKAVKIRETVKKKQKKYGIDTTSA